nr:uncharacterized protein LOC111424112 [Onthophagus taurus]
MIEFINDERKNFIALHSELERQNLKNLGFVNDFNLNNTAKMHQLIKLRTKKKGLVLLKEKLHQDLAKCDEEEKEIVEKKIKYQKEFPSAQLQLNILKAIISDIKHLNIDFVLVHVKENSFTAKLVLLDKKKEFIKIVVDTRTEMIIDCDLDNLKNANVKNELLRILETNKCCKVFFTKLCECLATK